MQSLASTGRPYHGSDCGDIDLSRALALVEGAAARQAREREELNSVTDRLRLLDAGVAIARQRVDGVRSKVSQQVTDSMLPLERAIAVRMDAALEALTAAVALERAYVAALEAAGVTRVRFQPSSFVPTTYLETWSVATLWRDETVKAGLLDVERATKSAA